MWPTVPTLPSIGTPRDSNDSWNLGRRRQFVPYGSGRNFAPTTVTTPQTARSLETNPPRSDGNSQDSEMIRLAYESHASSFFEEMKRDIKKDTTVLKEQYQMAMKRLGGTDPSTGPPPLDLEEEIRTLKTYVAELQGKRAAATRETQDKVSRADVEAICAAEVQRILDGNQLRPIILKTIESELTSFERRLRSQLGPLLDKLKSSDVALAKRINEVGKTSKDLEETVRRLATEQQRVGTARAQDWLLIAHRQLDDFGRSLKDCPAAAGNSSAEHLLRSMMRAQAALKETPVNSPSPSGLLMPGQHGLLSPVAEGPSWGEMADHGASPFGDFTDLDKYFDGFAQGNGQLGEKRAFDIGPDHGFDPSSNEDEIADKARSALEVLFFGEDMPQVVTLMAADDGMRDKARDALESFLLGGAADDQAEGIGQTDNAMRDKARNALETFLLDGPEDDTEEGALATKARGALEALLLDDAGEDDAAIASKARGALEALFFGDEAAEEEALKVHCRQKLAQADAKGELDAAMEKMQQATEDADEIASKARGALEALFFGQVDGSFADGSAIAEDLKSKTREALEASLLG